MRTIKATENKQVGQKNMNSSEFAFPATVAIPVVTKFDNSCFTGEYVTGDITPEYLERLGLSRHNAQDEASGLLFNMGYAAEDN